MSYLIEIEGFIKENFSPATADDANVKITTEGLLHFIFKTFPYDSIMEHQLVDLLTSLGFSRHTYVIEHTHVLSKEKVKIEKEMAVGWFMKTHLDLQTQCFFKKN